MSSKAGVLSDLTDIHLGRDAAARFIAEAEELRRQARQRGRALKWVRKRNFR